MRSKQMDDDELVMLFPPFFLVDVMLRSILCLVDIC
jgi:hypothetical protein